MVYIFENGLIDVDFDIDFKANSKSLKVDEILLFGDVYRRKKCLSVIAGLKNPIYMYICPGLHFFRIL